MGDARRVGAVREWRGQGAARSGSGAKYEEVGGRDVDDGMSGVR
jgi:hypothetical protein